MLSSKTIKPDKGRVIRWPYCKILWLVIFLYVHHHLYKKRICYESKISFGSVRGLVIAGFIHTDKISRTSQSKTANLIGICQYTLANIFIYETILLKSERNFDIWHKECNHLKSWNTIFPINRKVNSTCWVRRGKTIFCGYRN